MSEALSYTYVGGQAYAKEAIEGVEVLIEEECNEYELVCGETYEYVRAGLRWYDGGGACVLPHGQDVVHAWALDGAAGVLSRDGALRSYLLRRGARLCFFTLARGAYRAALCAGWVLAAARGPARLVANRGFTRASLATALPFEDEVVALAARHRATLVVALRTARGAHLVELADTGEASHHILAGADGAVELAGPGTILALSDAEARAPLELAIVDGGVVHLLELAREAFGLWTVRLCGTVVVGGRSRATSAPHTLGCVLTTDTLYLLTLEADVHTLRIYDRKRQKWSATPFLAEPGLCSLAETQSGCVVVVGTRRGMGMVGNVAGNTVGNVAAAPTAVGRQGGGASGVVPGPAGPGGVSPQVGDAAGSVPPSNIPQTTNQLTSNNAAQDAALPPLAPGPLWLERTYYWRLPVSLSNLPRVTRGNHVGRLLYMQETLEEGRGDEQLPETLQGLALVEAVQACALLASRLHGGTDGLVRALALGRTLVTDPEARAGAAQSLGALVRDLRVVTQLRTVFSPALSVQALRTLTYTRLLTRLVQDGHPRLALKIAHWVGLPVEPMLVLWVNTIVKSGSGSIGYIAGDAGGGTDASPTTASAKPTESRKEAAPIKGATTGPTTKNTTNTQDEEDLMQILCETDVDLREIVLAAIRHSEVRLADKLIKLDQNTANQVAYYSKLGRAARAAGVAARAPSALHAALLAGLWADLLAASATRQEFARAAAAVVNREGTPRAEEARRALQRSLAAFLTRARLHSTLRLYYEEQEDLFNAGWSLLARALASARGLSTGLAAAAARFSARGAEPRPADGMAKDLQNSCIQLIELLMLQAKLSKATGSEWRLLSPLQTVRRLLRGDAGEAGLAQATQVKQMFALDEASFQAAQMRVWADRAQWAELAAWLASHRALVPRAVSLAARRGHTQAAVRLLNLLEDPAQVQQWVATLRLTPEQKAKVHTYDPNNQNPRLFDSLRSFLKF